ncbi:hypothetical protein M514_25589 [Trichuris suis]|uniref:Uncharacterized protein n=1 Tax=Trichuris suis TaxID=68888 RepID=A0A085MYA3_9BILA|nr:hypothetical protein M514_25589 [Trichuris suis]
MHRDLKASLMATLQGDPNWADTLPIILMGMRAAFKPDIGTSAAELVLGETLRLPGQYFDRCSDEPHSEFAKDLRRAFARLRPGRFPQNSAPATLQYRVLERGPKSYLLELEAGVDSVSIDRLKPAFLAPGQPEATGPPISVETPETASDASRPQPCPVATRSGRLPRTPARFSDCLPFCQSQI